MSLLAIVVLGQLAATPAQVPPPVIAACTELASDQEARDQRRVAQAVAHPPSDTLELEAVLLRHATLHRVERCGDLVRVNSGDEDDGLYVQADMVGTITKATASKVRVDVTRSYLLDAAVIVAKAAEARGDQTTATRWLGWGLSIAPRDPALLALAASVTR